MAKENGESDEISFLRTVNFIFKIIQHNQNKKILLKQINFVMLRFINNYYRIIIRKIIFV